MTSFLGSGAVTGSLLSIDQLVALVKQPAKASDLAPISAGVSTGFSLGRGLGWQRDRHIFGGPINASADASPKQLEQ